MAVFKTGWISQFLSRAVIIGFLFGAGIQTAAGRAGGDHRQPGVGFEDTWQKL